MPAMRDYFRPIPETDPGRPPWARPLAGGWCHFSKVEVLSRTSAPRVIDVRDVPHEVLHRLTAPRAALAGLTMDAPRIMGILNVTPDSFSDGGQHAGEAAVAHAQAMAQAGAQILDIGGESTRPGAETVEIETEIARTAPIIQGIRSQVDTLVSIDTRKAPVAQAALQAGAGLVNDVAGFTYDPDLAGVAASAGVPVCVMHAQGDPATMQDAPLYDDVLLDVYDFLEARVAALVSAGIAADQIIVDPGIGFGKTLDHNLALLRRISLFHALGCPVLLGASRKRFIGTLTGVETAGARVIGSVAVAQAAWGQGVQIVRVHDVNETQQALTMWKSSTGSV